MSVEMNEQIQKARNEYMREYMRDYIKAWRRKNPKKAKDIQNRYWKASGSERYKRTVMSNFSFQTKGVSTANGRKKKGCSGRATNRN